MPESWNFKMQTLLMQRSSVAKPGIPSFVLISGVKPKQEGWIGLVSGAFPSSTCSGFSLTGLIPKMYCWLLSYSRKICCGGAQ